MKNVGFRIRDEITDLVDKFPSKHDWYPVWGRIWDHVWECAWNRVWTNVWGRVRDDEVKR